MGAFLSQHERLLASYTFLGSESEYTLLGIPLTGFKDLRVVARIRSQRAAVTSTIAYQFNADTGANYGYQRIRGSVATASAANSAGDGGSFNTFLWGGVPGSTGGRAGALGVHEMTILGYASTAFNKSVLYRNAYNTGPNEADTLFNDFAGWWYNAASGISSIRIFDTNSELLVAGSSVSLYGLAG